MEDLVRGADLLDPALVHHQHAVGELEGLVLVVRHEHAGQMDFVVQAAQPLAKLLANWASKAPNGSSKSNTRGSNASARASAALPLPPESWFG